MTRKSLSKKTRFEVFKRDLFTCQYCGRSAPTAVLRCDHIQPVAKGGSNHITNLITSCFDCNAGKSDRLIGDNSELVKQHAELAKIQERRNQLAMLKQWRDECVQYDEELCDLVEELFKRRFAVGLSERGRRNMIRLIKANGIEEVIESASVACSTYWEAENALIKLPGIIKARALDREVPGLGKLPYVAAILRNRLDYLNAGYLNELFRDAIDAGVNVESIVDIAKEANSWTQFRNSVELLINDTEPE